MEDSLEQTQSTDSLLDVLGRSALYILWTLRAHVHLQNYDVRASYRVAQYWCERGS